jgi:hypothetical protein
VPFFWSLLTVVALQSGPAHPDPAKCLTVIDDMGKVGFRISDAQALAEMTLSEFRRRQGNDAVVYEGFLVSSEALKKMLGARSESQVTDDQITYYKAAIANAKHRVRVKFGKRAKTHFIVVTCRKATASPDDVIEKKEITGKDFGEVREALAKELPTFCKAIPSTTGDSGSPSGGLESTTEPTPYAPPPKKKRSWDLPPKR